LSGLVLGGRLLGAILHSSNEPGELSQWLCHGDSTINIVLVIIIIIITEQLAVDAGYPLSQFVTFCADHYLSSENKEVRLEAVKTCSHLLTPSLNVSHYITACTHVFDRSAFLHATETKAGNRKLIN